MSTQRSTLLRHREFLKFWSSETISLFGSQITALALPLAAAVTLGASAGQMGLLGAVEFAPFLLFGLFAGVWVDRIKRGPVLMWANIGRALLLGTIPIAAWLNVLTIEQLYIVGFLTGILTVFFDVAYQSFLPVLVRRDQLTEGNSKLEVSRSTAQITGPGFAGALVQIVGAPGAILLNSISFLVSSILLSLVRANEEPPAPRQQGRNIWGEIGEGLGVVFGNPYLRSIAACTATSNFFSNLWGAVFFLYMTRELGLEAFSIGLVFGIGSLGALVGALLSSRITERFGLGPTIIGSQLLAAVSLWLLPLAAGPSALVVTIMAAGMILSSIGNTVYNINQVTLRQTITPDRLLGRMNASMRVIVWGTIPFGSLVGGFLGETIGLHNTFIVGVAGMLLAFIPVFFSPVRTLRQQPEAQPDEQANKAA